MYFPKGTIEERCNLFAAKAIKDLSWAFSLVINFFQFQKERVEKEEITGATLRNFIKPIKLFCEISDIPITWRKITRRLPKFRRYADDRAPLINYKLLISVTTNDGVLNNISIPPAAP